MNEQIVVMVEEPLNEADIRNLAKLGGGDASLYMVLVPQEDRRNLVAEFIDHLVLLEVSQAVKDLVRRQPKGDWAHLQAEQILASSLEAAATAGLTAQGQITAGDPAAALADFVTANEASQVVVITRPHAVADTFHRDWASQAQEHLGLPVLHLYSGSGFIGDS